MRRIERIKIAFFKGNKHELHHRFIRWWTKSEYSHAEIVIDGDTWVSISPFLYSHVAARIRTAVDQNDWDFIDFCVTADELRALKDFISETTGDGYDWIGMRHRRHCSDW